MMRLSLVAIARSTLSFLPRRDLASLLVSGFLIASVFSGVARALPAQPVDRSTVHWSVWPGSNLQLRLSAHRAEAKMPGFQPPPLIADPLAFTAADYKNLAKGSWEIRHQDLTIETEAAQSLLKVKIEAKLRPSPGNKTKMVRFYMGLLDVDSLKVSDLQGQPLPHTFKLVASTVGRLEVSLPTPLTEAIDTTIQVAYEATLNCDAGGYLLKSCSFDQEFESVMFYPYALRHGELSHDPFTSALHVLTDVEHVAAAPGIPLPPETLEDGRLRWTFLQPERTRNAGFAIAKYQPVGDAVPAQPSSDQPFVRVYTIGDFVQNAPAILKAAKAVLGFYAQRYVPFPWVGVNIIQNANSLGGGYSPLSGVFMLRNIFGAKPDTGYWVSAIQLMSHELAHQWWGNLARPQQAGDVALSESLAEFSSCLYTEKTLKSRRQIVGNNLSYIYGVPYKEDVPLGSNYVTTAKAYVPIVYHKGSVVMDMLRIEIGTQNMLDGLADYAAAFDRDYAQVSDLQVSMEKVSGRKLGWYFKQWFQKKGPIHVQVAGKIKAAEGSKWSARLRISTLGYVDMRFKLPLTVSYVDGSVEERLVDVLPQEDGPATVEVSLDKRPRGIYLDRGRRLLRVFELSTPGDVNLDGLTDGADFLDVAFQKGHSIRVTNLKGKSYFYANEAWDEIYDVSKDDNFIVDENDLDLVEDYLGAQAIDF